MRTITGKSTILSEATEYLHDESRFHSGTPEILYFPECTEDVQQIISDASLSRTPITFSGARTGTTGGATCTDGCIAVSFSLMKRIHSVKYSKTGSVILICEPGVTLTTINDFLEDPSSYPETVPGSDILGKGNYFFPPDPTEASAQLGGIVATNASGARSYRFGAVRSHVDSIALVIANGDLLSVSRGQYAMHQSGFDVTTESGLSLHIPLLQYKSPSTKNAAGYYCKENMDCVDLIIGSEGTLGAFVEIGITLQPKKTIISGLSFFPSREASFDFVDFLRSEQSIVSIEYFDTSALEFVNQYRKRFPDSIPLFPEHSRTALLWEWSEQDPHDFEEYIDTFSSHLESCGSSLDLSWSGIETAEQLLLKRFRHALPETINATISQNKLLCSEIRKIGTDTAVPSSYFKEIFLKSIACIEKNNIQYAAFGHIGDCHIHINLLPASKEQLNSSLAIYEKLMDMAIDCGGTVSAEHGIGKVKRKFLTKMYEKSTMEQMIAVKNAFDPLGIFNPENLF